MWNGIVTQRRDSGKVCVLSYRFQVGQERFPDIGMVGGLCYNASDEGPAGYVDLAGVVLVDGIGPSTRRGHIELVELSLG